MKLLLSHYLKNSTNCQNGRSPPVHEVTHFYEILQPMIILFSNLAHLYIYMAPLHSRFEAFSKYNVVISK